MKNLVHVKKRKIKKLPMIILILCLLITSIFIYLCNRSSVEVVIVDKSFKMTAYSTTNVDDVLVLYSKEIDKIKHKYIVENQVNKVVVSNNNKVLNSKQKISKYKKINIDFYTSIIEKESVKIDYTQVVKKDENKNSDFYEIVTPGVNGVKQLIFETVYKNGEIINDRYLKSEKIEKSVIDEVVVVGTKNIVRIESHATYVNDIIIVNKKHPLSSNYAPGEDLDALTNFRNLLNEMSSLGYNISTTNYSGYRSYEKQKSLYNNYVQNDGEVNANKYSAKPGYSEHQTGLAFDILNSNLNLLGQDIGDENAVNWLANNAHKYGFIIRYMEGKEEITGYMYEPWHVRYVGIPIATNIYNNNQVLEEYLNVEGGEYE